MADATIEILIKAVDEMSVTLNKIEKRVTETAQNTSKGAEKMSTSFTDTASNLIALGNAAATVDNIFSAYQNQQIRVENASERLNNAQDRLTDSQKKLNKLQRDGTTSLEDLQDAQDEVTRASRGLTIAQNNLERVNGQVIGTYINMGIQIIGLLGSLPQLVKAINAVRNSTILAEAFTTPWALALGAAAAGAALLYVNSLDASSGTDAMTNAQDKALTAFSSTNRAITEQSAKLKGYFEGLIEQTKVTTKEERDSQLKLIEQREKVTDIQLVALKDEKTAEEQAMADTLLREETKLRVMEEKHKLEFIDRRKNAQDAIMVLQTSLDEQIKLINQFGKGSIDVYNQIAEANRLIGQKSKSSMNFVPAQAIKQAESNYAFSKSPMSTMNIPTISNGQLSGNTMYLYLDSTIKMNEKELGKASDRLLYQSIYNRSS